MWNTQNKPMGFGSSTANTFGTPGGFGQKPATSSFGSTPAPSGFGGVTSTPFQATNRPFGSTSPGTTGGGFGAAPSTGGFGGASLGGGGAFGAPQFGQQQQQALSFGAPQQQTSGFGGFGQKPSPTTSSLSSPFGGGGFGSSTGWFGSTLGGQQQQPFGTTAAQPFGAPQQQQATLGGFGSSLSSAANPFGSSSGFSLGGGGALGGGLVMGGGVSEGTGNPPFAPLMITEATRPGQPSQNLHIQVITAMKQYEHKSQEELRFEDYRRGVKGPGQQPQQQQGAFGAGAFGSTSSPFGAPAVTASAPLFGSATATGGGFGGFGSAAPSTTTAASPFGLTSSSGAFGQPQQTLGSAFGQQQTSAFGAPATTSAFGGFGSTQQQQPFGATTAQPFGAPQQQQATSAFGGFGSIAAKPTVSFGSPTLGGGFGTTTALQQPSSSSFGSFGTQQQQQPSAFGATTAAPSAFGTTQPSAFGSGGTFGQPQQQATSTLGGGFGQSAFGTTTAPATTSAFGGFGTSAMAKPTVSFGGATTTGSFGVGAFGSTPTTGGFGFPLGGQQQQPFGASAATPTLGGSFGGFGNLGATQPLQQPSTFGTGGGFGSAPSATGFGSTGGFGAAPSAFGTTGGAFGGTTSTFGGGGFQQQQPQAQQASQFSLMGGQAIQQQQFQQQQQQQPLSQLSELQQKMDFLNQRKDELEIHLKDDKLAMQSQLLQYQQQQLQQQDQQASRSIVTLMESPTMNVRGNMSMSSMIPSAYRHTPRSTAKITPRGFQMLTTTPTTAARTGISDDSSSRDHRPLGASAIKLQLTKQLTMMPSSTTGGADSGMTTSFLRPENLITRSAKKLVIGPSFHKPSSSSLLLTSPPAVATSGSNGANGTDQQQQSQLQQLDSVTPVRPSSALLMNQHSGSHHGNGSASATSSATTPHLSDSLLPSSSTQQQQQQRDSSVSSRGDRTGLTPYATRSPIDHNNSSSSSMQSPLMNSSGSSGSSSVFDDMRANTSNNQTLSRLHHLSHFVQQDQTQQQQNGDEDEEDGNMGIQTKSSSSSTSTTAADSKMIEKPIPPILTLAGYETSPSLETLQLVENKTDLQTVRNFTVYRPGYGSIEWLGETDVNGLNLDKLIKIEKNAVMVYYDDEEEENDNEEYHNGEKASTTTSTTIDPEKKKPMVGQGLNKPAIITLFNVFPKEGTNVSKILQYERKLRNACIKSGSEFMDYNPVTGRWMFRVEHFSKYGIDDDDDEEEVVAAADSKTTAATAAMMNVKQQQQRQVVVVMPPIIKSSAKTLRLNKNLSLSAASATATSGINRNDDNDYDSSLQYQQQQYQMGGTGGTVINTATAFNTVTPVRQAIAMETVTTTPLSQYYHINSSTSSGVKRPLSTAGLLLSATSTTPYVAPSASAVKERGEDAEQQQAKVEEDEERKKTEEEQLQRYQTNYEAYLTELLYTQQHPSTLTHLIDTSFYDSATKMPNSVTMKILWQVKQRYFDAVGLKEIVPVYTSLHSTGSTIGGIISSTPPTLTTGSATTNAKKYPICEFGLAMGQSFRVGWSADGRIVHCGHSIYNASGINENNNNSNKIMLNVQQVVIEPSVLSSTTTKTNNNDDDSMMNNEYMNGIFNALLTQSKITHNHSTASVTAITSPNIPLYSAPLANRDDWSEYHRFLELLKSCKQVYTCLKQKQKALQMNTTTKNDNNNNINSLASLGNKIIEFMQASIGQEKWSYDDDNNDTAENDAYFMPFLEQRGGGGEGSSDNDDEVVVPVHLWERRREAVSQWLQSICIDAQQQVQGQDVGSNILMDADALQLVDEGKYAQSIETYDRIFYLLTVRRITEAVTVAEKAGMYRLAMLLCQADGDENFTLLLRQQLALWCYENNNNNNISSPFKTIRSGEGVITTADETIPESLLKIYRMLAGLPTRLGPIENKVYHDSCLTGLGWERAIGVFYWYCKQTIQYPIVSSPQEEVDDEEVDGMNEDNKMKLSSSSAAAATVMEPMALALLQYKLAVKDGDADYPYPPVIISNSTDTDTNNITSLQQQQQQQHSHSLYNLLEIFFGQEQGGGDSDSNDNDNLSMERYIIAALQSESSSNNSNSHTLDYRISFLILTLLQSCAVITPIVSTTTTDDASNDVEGSITMISSFLPMCACIVRQHMLSQLLSSKQYKWALFVCLTITDVFQRHYLIKEIVLRYLGDVADNGDEDIENILTALSTMSPSSSSSTTTSQVGFNTNSNNNILTNSSSDNSILTTATNNPFITSKEIDYLVNELYIPVHWVHEAKAYYNGYIHNQLKQIQHFNKSNSGIISGDSDSNDNWFNQQANRVLCDKIAPLTVIEMKDTKIQSLLQLLQQMNPQACVTDLEDDSSVILLNKTNVDNVAIVEPNKFTRSQVVLHYLWIQRDVDVLLNKNNNIMKSKATVNIDTAADAYDQLNASIVSIIKRCHHLLQIITHIYTQIIHDKQMYNQLHTPREPVDYFSSSADVILATRTGAVTAAGGTADESLDAYPVACYHMSTYLVEIMEKINKIFVDMNLAENSIFSLLFEPTTTPTSVMSKTENMLSVKATVPVSDKVRMQSIQHECVLQLEQSSNDVTQRLLEALMV